MTETVLTEVNLDGTDMVKGFRSKVFWMDWAEITDAWRLVPRVILFGFASWTVHFTDRISLWYTHLPGVERTPVELAAVTALTAIPVGLFTAAMKWYMENGRAWGSK